MGKWGAMNDLLTILRQDLDKRLDAQNAVSFLSQSSVVPRRALQPLLVEVSGLLRQVGSHFNSRLVIIFGVGIALNQHILFFFWSL